MARARAVPHHPIHKWSGSDLDYGIHSSFESAERLDNSRRKLTVLVEVSTHVQNDDDGLQICHGIAPVHQKERAEVLCSRERSSWSSVNVGTIPG